MTNSVLSAVVLAMPLLIGNAVQTCGGSATLKQTEGVEPNTAIAVVAPPPHVPDDAEAVEVVRSYASMLAMNMPPLAGVPKSVRVPPVVVAARKRPDGSLSLQFPPGPPPAELRMIFLVPPEDALEDPPVWYDEETDRILYCLACAASEPFSPEMLGLLYVRALFDQATVDTVKDEASDLRRLMTGTRLMLWAVDHASGSSVTPRLVEILSHAALSDEVVPGSPWRIPSDSGWTHVDFVWPWTTRSSAETDVTDDLVHLFCALQQGKTPLLRQQAFRVIWDYTQQGC